MADLKTVVVAGCVLMGCTTARMAVPPEIAKGTEEVLATERSAMSGALPDESFKLGQFAIEDVDRNWNSSRCCARRPLVWPARAPHLRVRSNQSPSRGRRAA
jgi:hypothetical protein